MITKVPELLTLEDYVEVYVENNIQWIVNEYKFDLGKAETRLEIVNGLLKALTEIDKIIATIKQAESEAKAVQTLTTLGYSQEQAKAITDMRLGKLAHLEGVALEKEAANLEDIKKKCAALIESENAQKKEFLSRLGEFVKKYGYDRHTQITQIEATPDEEKEVVNVEPEQCIVVLSQSGYSIN